eukprot:CAMPEP_0173375378 /NCGR_PEP_ID=MMETSP1144-20121109/29596_1 /TAXON_ID=483371 /ORGANISM="non described non described, Strain CCMP2298" /LENGTH=118 /DNA_ID=CAMNT_0014327809 /DNA_START=659 /DNA_END=1015 /DNA_ORIENTATION=+
MVGTPGRGQGRLHGPHSLCACCGAFPHVQIAHDYSCSSTFQHVLDQHLHLRGLGGLGVVQRNTEKHDRCCLPLLLLLLLLCLRLRAFVLSPMFPSSTWRAVGCASSDVSARGELNTVL